jgi:hypothetical protein
MRMSLIIRSGDSRANCRLQPFSAPMTARFRVESNRQIGAWCRPR